MSNDRISFLPVATPRAQLEDRPGVFEKIRAGGRRAASKGAQLAQRHVGVHRLGALGFLGTTAGLIGGVTLVTGSWQLAGISVVVIGIVSFIAILDGGLSAHHSSDRPTERW